MKQPQLPTDPYLFRLLKRAFAGLTLLLLLCAAWIPPPLQQPGTAERVPNPVKAAWFLVWMQELVSHSVLWTYPVFVLGLVFFLLPFLPGMRRAEQASWLPGDQRLVNVLTLCVFCLIVSLSIVALFFRGENWQFVFIY